MKRPKVQIRENSWLARQAARKLGYDYVAMVFGNTIHLYNTSLEKFFARPSWVIHELKHVEQYQRLGIFSFLVKYIADYLRVGYWDNVFEIEARAAESDTSLLQQFDLSAYQVYMKTGFGITA